MNSIATELPERGEYQVTPEAASLRVRAWLRETLLAKLAAIPEAPACPDFVGDKRLLGLVPKKAERPKRDKGFCACGAKAFTRAGRCRRCYDQARPGRKASTAFHVGAHSVNFKGTPTEKLRELRDSGMSYAEIGAATGLHASTVFGRLKNSQKGAEPCQ